MLQDFQHIQIQIAEHLRDPENNPAPAGLEPRRLAVYRRLFFNNMVQFISKAFPVLNTLYTTANWHRLVRAFYARYANLSPYFADISKAFVDYLNEQHQRERHEPPFLAPLAHYEWAEAALLIADRNIDWPQIDTAGDVCKEIPILSPLAWRFSYDWAVHRIGQDYCPQTPDTIQTHLVLCRQRSGRVDFMLLSETANALYQELEERPLLHGFQMIENVCERFCMQQTPALLESGRGLLERMRQKEVVLGTARVPRGGASGENPAR